MQDKHTGKAGTFYIDPEAGTRMTQKEWDRKQAGKTSKQTAKPNEQKEVDHATSAT